MSGASGAPRVRLRDITLADADLLDAWAADPAALGEFNDFGLERDPVDLIETVVQRIAEVAKVDRVSIVLVREQGDIGYVVVWTTAVRPAGGRS